jgi:hypothetical protein
MSPANASTFNLRDHHLFVTRHGDTVQHRQAMKCPCGATPDANRARFSCPVCLGLGFRYSAPVSLIGLVTGVRHERDLVIAGVAAPGDCMLGLSPYETRVLGDWDCIRLSWADGEPYDGDVLTRGIDTMADALTYDVKAVTAVFSVDPNTGAITTYVSGTDFVIAGRTLTWQAGEAMPTPGTAYTAAYRAIFEWVCFVAPLQRYERGTKLGQRALLRKRHLALAARP